MINILLAPKAGSVPRLSGEIPVRVDFEGVGCHPGGADTRVIAIPVDPKLSQTNLRESLSGATWPDGLDPSACLAAATQEMEGWATLPFLSIGPEVAPQGWRVRKVEHPECPTIWAVTSPGMEIHSTWSQPIHALWDSWFAAARYASDPAQFRQYALFRVVVDLPPGYAIESGCNGWRWYDLETGDDQSDSFDTELEAELDAWQCYFDSTPVQF